MNKESLTARIKELETARDQHRASLVAHEGAIQELNNWLSKLDEPKKED